jgi:hypothetical protein
MNLNHSVLNRGFEKLGGIGHTNLLHHGRTMGFDGLHADFQTLCDFPILETGPDELKDFLFTIG